MSEEDFYKAKIFNKISINALKLKYPHLNNSINKWYKSERYNRIQKYKTFLSTKIAQLRDDGEDIYMNNEQLYELFQWWERTPKICYYCSLPEESLDELHNKPGHINKRYPKRGKSLEIDRKQSDLPYTSINNLTLACYWCNNAKTDTFTEDEFLQIGKVMKDIWQNRLNVKL